MYCTNVRITLDILLFVKYEFCRKMFFLLQPLMLLAFRFLTGEQIRNYINKKAYKLIYNNIIIRTKIQSNVQRIILKKEN